MKLSEVMTKIQKLQQTIDDAQAEMQTWVEELPYTECDHPEFSDHICDHCGAYVDYSEEMLKFLDDYNVLQADSMQGHYPDAAFESPYFQWPLERT